MNAFKIIHYDQYGNVIEDDEDQILRDGESIRVPQILMDAAPPVQNETTRCVLWDIDEKAARAQAYADHYDEQYRLQEAEKRRDPSSAAYHDWLDQLSNPSKRA